MRFFIERAFGCATHTDMNDLRTFEGFEFRELTSGGGSQQHTHFVCAFVDVPKPALQKARLDFPRRQTMSRRRLIQEFTAFEAHRHVCDFIGRRGFTSRMLACAFHKRCIALSEAVFARAFRMRPQAFGRKAFVASRARVRVRIQGARPAISFELRPAGLFVLALRDALLDVFLGARAVLVLAALLVFAGDSRAGGPFELAFALAVLFVLFGAVRVFVVALGLDRDAVAPFRFCRRGAARGGNRDQGEDRDQGQPDEFYMFTCPTISFLVWIMGADRPCERREIRAFGELATFKVPALTHSWVALPRCEP